MHRTRKHWWKMSEVRVAVVFGGGGVVLATIGFGTGHLLITVLGVLVLVTGMLCIEP